MIPEIRPYENGSSEPDSLRLHVYRKPSDDSVLLANVQWHILIPDEGKLKLRTISDREVVPSLGSALEKATQFAIERSIPVIFVQNDAA
ncbi:MAG: hypothetical protein ACYSU7_14510 [Planctomycetota bacterium]|jgi:hypothetical protein